VSRSDRETTIRREQSVVQGICCGGGCSALEKKKRGAAGKAVGGIGRLKAATTGKREEKTGVKGFNLA